MTREVYAWIVNASSVSPLVPLICLWIYRKGQPKQNLILAISLFISFVFDAISWSLAVWHNPRSTNFSNNLYFMISFPAIMWFYHETLVKRSLKILVRAFTVGFLVFSLIFAVDQGLIVMNYNIMMFSSILITITSLLFVGDLKLMDESNFANNRFHEANIILNTSLALYYFATIILFAMTDYIFSNFSVEDTRLFWACHNALNILKNIGIAFAFYVSFKRSRKTGDPQQHHQHPRRI